MNWKSVIKYLRQSIPIYALGNQLQYVAYTTSWSWLGTISICKKQIWCSWGDISLRSTNVNLILAVQEKSGDHQNQYGLQTTYPKCL